MIEELHAGGHAAPARYTPRQAIAFAELAARRQRRDARADLALQRLAYHADRDALRKAVRDLDD